MDCSNEATQRQSKISASMSFEEDEVFEQVEMSPSLIDKQIGHHKKNKVSAMQALPQHAELRLYLDMKISEPFNHYCISCKKNKSSHVILWIGSYVCKGCAANLVQFNGGMRNCYVKDVFNEQWDDYQLKSLAFGGN